MSLMHREFLEDEERVSSLLLAGISALMAALFAIAAGAILFTS